MTALLRRWPYAVFLSVDLLVSAVTFGAPYETISARLGAAKGLGHWSCRAVDFVVRVLFRAPDHCENALRAYVARNAAVAHLR
jgi:hypothetical protein